MEIKTFLPGDADFDLFENFPRSLYPAESIRHRQHDHVSTEFLAACYVVLQNGLVKARAALYDNPQLYFEGKKACAVGNFEAVDDGQIARALLLHLETEAKNHGAHYLIGPMNGSTWENYRFSLDHDHANFFLEPFHHLYYNDLFRNAGFEVISRYSSNIETDFPCDYPDVLEREKALEAAGLVIRSIDLQHFDNELAKLFPFIAEAFSGNFLYTPSSWESFKRKYTEAAKIIRQEFVLVAEDSHGQVVGFIFCYDDLFSTTEKCLVMKTLARSQEPAWKGLGQVLANCIIRKMKKQGYHSQIHAFMIDDGASTHASRKFSGGSYKKYALYGKKI